MPFPLTHYLVAKSVFKNRDLNKKEKNQVIIGTVIADILSHFDILTKKNSHLENRGLIQYYELEDKYLSKRGKIDNFMKLSDFIHLILDNNYYPGVIAKEGIVNNYVAIKTNKGVINTEKKTTRNVLRRHHDDNYFLEQFLFKEENICFEELKEDFQEARKYAQSSDFNESLFPESFNLDGKFNEVIKATNIYIDQILKRILDIEKYPYFIPDLRKQIIDYKSYKYLGEISKEEIKILVEKYFYRLQN